MKILIDGHHGRIIYFDLKHRLFFFLKQSIFHIKENLIDQDRENILEIPRMNDTDRRAKHFNYK
jgi:hypothetical protein